MGHDRRTPLMWAPSRSGRLVLLPVLLILAIVLVDDFTPPGVHLGPLLVAAPALTASFAGARLTAAVGALAVAGQFAIFELRGAFNTSNNLTQAAALIVVSAVVVLYCRVRERHAAELHQVRFVADAAQRVLLRPPPPVLGPLRLATAYRAAVDEARIGGDFYGAVRVRQCTRLLIGDVRGKGLGAMDEAALLLGAFRAAAHENMSLGDVAAHLDGVLSRNMRSDEGAENFATALLLDVPDGQEHARVLSCGHPPPLRVRGEGAAPLLVPQPSPPLGLASLQPGVGRTQDHPFSAGDTLLLYTDGVIEARNAAGEFYPLAERLPRWSHHTSPDRLLDAVLRDLAAHTGGALNDDAALFAVRRTALTPGPSGATRDDKAL